MACVCHCSFAVLFMLQLSFFFFLTQEFFLYSKIFFSSFFIFPLVFVLISPESIISIVSIYNTVLRISILVDVLLYFPLSLGLERNSQFLGRRILGLEQVLLGNE